ncbi:MAG: hypothetical protein MZV64_37020 [Ignavibacteriales bacterium]|nr:hypothetical protein [Ignavibacteriales bacterium]
MDIGFEHLQRKVRFRCCQGFPDEKLPLMGQRVIVLFPDEHDLVPVKGRHKSCHIDLSIRRQYPSRRDDGRPRGCSIPTMAMNSSRWSRRNSRASCSSGEESGPGNHAPSAPKLRVTNTSPASCSPSSVIPTL